MKSGLLTTGIATILKRALVGTVSHLLLVTLHHFQISRKQQIQIWDFCGQIVLVGLHTGNRMWGWRDTHFPTIAHSQQPGIGINSLVESLSSTLKHSDNLKYLEDNALHCNRKAPTRKAYSSTALTCPPPFMG